MRAVRAGGTARAHRHKSPTGLHALGKGTDGGGYDQDNRRPLVAVKRRVGLKASFGRITSVTRPNALLGGHPLGAYRAAGAGRGGHGATHRVDGRRGRRAAHSARIRFRFRATARTYTRKASGGGGQPLPPIGSKCSKSPTVSCFCGFWFFFSAGGDRLKKISPVESSVAPSNQGKRRRTWPLTAKCVDEVGNSR